MLSIFVMQEPENLAFLSKRGEAPPARWAKAHRAAGGTPALRRNTMNRKLLFLLRCLDCLPESLLLTCQAPAGGMPSHLATPFWHPSGRQPERIPGGGGTLLRYPRVPHAGRRSAFGRSDCYRVRKRAATDAPAAQLRSTNGGAQVNQLVLVNNSKRPLILLAGEIVTGGKQDRVIGKDRIIPAESDPMDLGVFCVEPGRWVGSSDRFGVGAGWRLRRRHRWRPRLSALKRWPTRISSRCGPR